MELTPETAPTDLAGLSTDGEAIEETRRRLERLVNVLAEPRVSVAIDDNRAFARPAGGDHGAEYEIHVPERPLGEPTTRRERAAADRARIAILFHELGHVEYSDFDRFQERQSELSEPFRELFRSLCNAAEDVAIERQLAAEFSVGADFAVTNDAFRRLQDAAHRRYVDLFFDGDAPLTYTVFEALTVLVQDAGFGEVDRRPSILDPADGARRIHDEGRAALLEVLPEVHDMLDESLTTPDGTERVDRAFECVDRIRPALEDLPLVQLKRVQTREPRSFESESAELGDAKRADRLDGDRRLTVDGSVAGTVRGSADRDPSDRNPLDAVIERLDGAVEGDRPPVEREARALLDVVRSDETPVDAATVCEPDPGGQPPEGWASARRAARSLESDLRAHLRRRRRTSPEPGHRTGAVDPHRLVAASQGRSHVFKRRQEGDDRDYSCLIVLDRSGSMGGEPIVAAEDAAAQLSIALSSVGVDVSVLSLLEAQPRLELPFGAQPRQYAGSILSGRTSGGTPLSEAVAIGRDRLQQGSGTVPLLVVLTDGVPDDPGAYRRELQRCTFPVYGIYIGDEIPEHGAWFDRILYADASSVDRTLREFARRLFRV